MYHVTDVLVNLRFDPQNCLSLDLIIVSSRNEARIYFLFHSNLLMFDKALSRFLDNYTWLHSGHIIIYLEHRRSISKKYNIDFSVSSHHTFTYTHRHLPQLVIMPVSLYSPQTLIMSVSLHLPQPVLMPVSLYLP